MSVCLCVCVFVCVQALESDTPEGSQRMSDWLLDFPRIDIYPFFHFDANIATLSNTLQQLGSLRTAPGVPVRLKGWEWTEPMAQVAQAMPTLGHLTLGVCSPLTDATLGVLLHMGESYALHTITGFAYTLKAVEYTQSTPANLASSSCIRNPMCCLPMIRVEAEQSSSVPF